MGLLEMFSICATDVPVGAQADAKELQYISTLLQTSLPDIRPDATVSATDVRLYLRSMYGLDITPEVAIDIVRGLGGMTEKKTKRRGGGGGGAGRHRRDVDVAAAAFDDNGSHGKRLKPLGHGDDDQNGEEEDSCKADDGGHSEDGKDDEPCKTEDDGDIGAGDKEKDDAKPAEIDDEEVASSSPLDEEMGLFASATGTAPQMSSEDILSNEEEREGGRMISPNNGDEGLSRQSSSSVFFDAMQSDRFSSSSLGSGYMNPSKDEEVDAEAEVEPEVAAASEKVDLTVVTSMDEVQDNAQVDEDMPERQSSTNEKVQWSPVPVPVKSEEMDEPPLSPSTAASEYKEVYLDLLQLLSALLIPTLMKAKREADIANGIIEDEPEVPDDPEKSCCLLLRHPVQFAHNVRECRRLRRNRKEKAIRDSLRPTPRRIIRDVLVMLITQLDECNPNPMLRRAQESKDVRKKRPDGTPRLRRVVIDESLVRNLLVAYGEDDAADDDELVREMMIVAGGEGAILDELAFAKALTSDVLAWNTGMEDGLNETFFDVFGFIPIAKNEYDLERHILNAGVDVVADTADLAIAAGITAVDAAAGTVEAVGKAEGDDTKAGVMRPADEESPETTTKEVTEEDGDEKGKNAIKFFHTAHYIDYVKDSFRSLLFQMALYVYYLFSAAIGMAIINTMNRHQFITCEPSFWCNLGEQVWQWFALAFVLSVSGVLVIVPISMANDPYNQSWKRTTLSILWLLFITLTTFFALYFYNKGVPHDPSGQLNELEKLVQGFYFQLALQVYLAFGVVLCVFMLRFAAQICTPKDMIRRNRVLRALTLPYGIRRGTDIKEACTRKLNSVLSNAVSQHFRDFHGAKVTAAERFMLEPKKTIRLGGFFWTWHNILTRKLSRHHGIWLHSRLATAQECQVIFLLFAIVLLVWGGEELAQGAERKREQISEEPDGPLKDEALRFVPEGWVVMATFAFGGVFAIGVSVVIILVYIPSTVATIMQLRTGKIPTYDDPNHFMIYRKAADKVFYNVANTIYALLGSAGLFFIIFGGIFFLFLWPVSAQTMLLLLSWCLGLTITISLKTIVLGITRAKFHRAFMRRRPKGANYNSLAMECWQLGLGGGTLLSRLCQFLFAAAFWIGRIDVHFLDESVNLLGYSFDYTPIYYRTEILVHETHKHPWINRLGGMFLMRLKHGPNFSSQAGAKWRLLFSIALFPWLGKYRQQIEDEEEDMLISSILSPKVGRIKRLKNRIAAREGLRVFKDKGKQQMKNDVQESHDSRNDNGRTGVDVLME